MAEKNVADVLAELFRRAGMRRQVQRAQLVLMWPRVAGPELSRFTKASSFRDGVLYVDTTDSETAMHLGLQRTRFLESFHRSGARELKDIRFRPGRIDEPLPDKDPLPEAADEADLAPLEAALAGSQLPEGLAEAASRAASGIARTRTMRRQLGWQPCAVCDGLTEKPGLCLTCRRYAEAPATARAAQELSRDPEATVPWLTEAQRDVAAWLAAAELARQVQQLLPKTLADQQLLPELEQLAGRWLVLRLGKPAATLTDQDWLQLPEAVGRVLGRR